MDDKRLIQFAGVSLVTSALAFVAVFSTLAVTFNYPDVLDQPPSVVLPAFLQGGASLHRIWWVYSLLPLLLLPAAAGAFQALRKNSEGLMRLASYCGVLAALTLTLGLIRWPSLNHELALLHAKAGEVDRRAIEAIVAGLDQYLGTYIGEQLGEIFLNAWFILTGAGMLRTNRFPSWCGWAGIVVGVLGMAGVFRFATEAVQMVADVNNFLLPAWLLTFGIALWRYGPSPDRP